jgi:hypothetical protein
MKAIPFLGILPVLYFLFFSFVSCYPQDFPLAEGYYWETSRDEILRISEKEGYLVLDSYSLAQDTAGEPGSLRSEKVLEWEGLDLIHNGYFRIDVNGESFVLFLLESNPLEGLNQALINQSGNAYQPFYLTPLRSRQLEISDPQALLEEGSQKLRAGGTVTGLDLMRAMGRYEVIEFSYEDVYDNAVQYSKGQEVMNNSDFRLRRLHNLNNLDFHFKFLSGGLLDQGVEFQPKGLSKTGDLIWNQYNFAPAEVSENLTFAYYQGRILIDYSWDQGSLGSYNLEVILERISELP